MTLKTPRHNDECVLFIDGERHHVVSEYRKFEPLPPEGGFFYVDALGMVGRPCSRHYLSRQAVAHIRAGGAITSNGHNYRATYDYTDTREWQAYQRTTLARHRPAPQPTLWQRLTTTLKGVFQ